MNPHILLALLAWYPLLWIGFFVSGYLSTAFAESCEGISAFCCNALFFFSDLVDPKCLGVTMLIVWIIHLIGTIAYIVFIK